MIKIIKGRREGKTTELIKMSHDTNTYILVADRSRVQEIESMARDVLALNDLILEAVVHGADMGGAYCQNDVGLKKAMQYFINRLCLENYEITEVEITRHDGRWKVPQFKEKESE